MILETQLEECLNDIEVEDLVLNPNGLFIFKNGTWLQKSSETKIALLKNLSQQIAEESQQSLSQCEPSLDAQIEFPNGLKFRAHAICSPMVESGPVITLRRLNSFRRFNLSDFCKSKEEQSFIETAFLQKKSILIAGATGSGKTSFISSLFQLITPHERVIVLEDSPELGLPTPLSTKLISRKDRFGFRNGATWDLEHLVFESLRMRPDRMILGECRSTEAFAINQAMETGHGGVLTSIHAGNCTEAQLRFEKLVRLGCPQPNLVPATFDLILFIKREGSKRYVSEIKKTS